jgi:phosphoglucosamine mutase
MKKLFGTDGMRGVAGRFPLDSETIKIVGRSLAKHLSKRLGRAPRFVTGRDTRESGAQLEQALITGAQKESAACQSAGIITTPGVAFLARTLEMDAGVVLSASHNPFADNGVKIFAPDGRKIDDEMERLIEADIRAATRRENDAMPRDDFHFVKDADANAAALQARYLDYLCESVAADLNLKGLRIVADCANGAAYALAPKMLARLGADVRAINDAPDGRNINLNCGSLHLENLQRTVVETKADAGVGYDGDADRALFVDARGEIVDGDAVLWVMAQFFDARGAFPADKRFVVATVMSNIGLERALATRGIALRRTDVGDKNVLDELLRAGGILGGEQSGHIIFPRESLVGDGLMTTIHLLRAMRESGKPLHELTVGFARYPQILVNVRVGEKRSFADVPQIIECAREIETKLGAKGRLLLRYSGTEPLARVMIEGERQSEIEAFAQRLAKVIENALGEKEEMPRV